MCQVKYKIFDDYDCDWDWASRGRGHMGQTPRPVSRALLDWSRRELEALASAVEPPGVRPLTFGSSGIFKSYLEIIY